MSNPMNPILSVEDLDVKFHLRGETLHAIRGISLDVYKGESLAIVGESGSGKSVFTKTFLGLLDSNGFLDDGHIYFHLSDEDPSQVVDLASFQTEKEWLTIRGKQIAMIMQDPMTSLNPLKTIGAQIEEAILLHQKIDRHGAHAQMLSVLKDVGIDEPERRARQYPHEFSGGMRQRVVIAIAVACRIRTARKTKCSPPMTPPCTIIPAICPCGRNWRTAISFMATRRSWPLTGKCSGIDFI